jgi:creatinine amidohydrolase
MSANHALPSYNLADLAWPDIQRFVEGDSICLIPIGSIECHGPHIPVGCDTYHCVEVVERAAPAAGVPYTPVLPFGYSPHHVREAGEGMGTVTLRASTCQAVWHDIARSVIHMGFRKLIFVNGHASNVKAIDPVMRRLRNEHGALVAIYKPYGERYLGIMEDLLDSPPEETPGWHAAEQETSQMMAHDERLVHMDRLGGFWETARAPDWMPETFTKWDGGGVIEFQGYEYLSFAMEHQEFAPTAVIGNPMHATVDKGRKIYDRFGQYLMDAVAEIREIEVGPLRNVEFTERAL